MTDPISNLGSRVDLQLRQGADFATSISFTNPDNTAVDLTGYAFAAQIRQHPLDPGSAVGTFATSIPTPASGVVQIALPASVTGAINCGNSIMDDASLFWWTLKMTDAGGSVSTPLYGQVRVAPRVTA